MEDDRAVVSGRIGLDVREVAEAEDRNTPVRERCRGLSALGGSPVRDCGCRVRNNGLHRSEVDVNGSAATC
jgi:hypothetical protein